MSSHAAMVFLMLISPGAGSFSMHQVASYESRAVCNAAQDAVKKAVGSARQAIFACVSEESLGAWEDANR